MNVTHIFFRVLKNGGKFANFINDNKITCTPKLVLKIKIR